MKIYRYWCCELTGLEDMKFTKWLENNPQIPRPNTITTEQRTELLSNWLKEHRKCKDNQ